MNYLTVFHLQSEPLGAESEQKLADGLSDIFRAFCSETFPSEEPIDWPPLRIVPAASPEELQRRLFSDETVEGMLTDDGKACILFMLDDAFADPAQPDRHLPLHALHLEGLPLT